MLLTNYYVNSWREEIVALDMATEENQENPLSK
jgi:hypothetical protein